MSLIEKHHISKVLDRFFLYIDIKNGHILTYKNPHNFNNIQALLIF